MVTRKKSVSTHTETHAGTAIAEKKQTLRGDDPSQVIKKEIEKYEKSKNKPTIVTTTTKKSHAEVTEIEKHVSNYVKKIDKELSRSSLDSSTKEKTKKIYAESATREIEDLHSSLEH